MYGKRYKYSQHKDKSLSLEEIFLHLDITNYSYCYYYYSPWSYWASFGSFWRLHWPNISLPGSPRISFPEMHLPRPQAPQSPLNSYAAKGHTYIYEWQFWISIIILCIKLELDILSLLPATLQWDSLSCQWFGALWGNFRWQQTDLVDIVV